MADAKAIGRDLVITRRYLPHWQAGGSTYFLAFRLADAVPQLAEEEQRLIKRALLFWHGSKWHVHLLTVMPDHVHVLATPLEMTSEQWHSLSEILKSVKRHSARELNRARGTTGQLWQHEGYDRLIRNQREFERRGKYIIDNAQVADLTDNSLHYPGFWCEGMEVMTRTMEALWRKLVACAGEESSASYKLVPQRCC